MAEMDDKLNAILGNPQMMQQIMSMAQMLQQSGPEQTQPETPPPPPPPVPPQMGAPGLDAASIQKLFAIARQSGIDKHQQALLNALCPYLSRDRIVKLERAMRAAKLSALASSALGADSLPFFSGR